MKIVDPPGRVVTRKYINEDVTLFGQFNVPLRRARSEVSVAHFTAKLPGLFHSL